MADSLREAVKRSSRTQQERAAKYVVDGFAVWFQEVVESASKITKPTVSSLETAIGYKKLTKSLVQTGVRLLTPAFVVGAVTAGKTAKFTKATTAEEIIDALDIEVPDSIIAGPFPAWMLQAASDAMESTFLEPYWQKVVDTTRDDIARTLNRGVEDGLSIRKIAKLIAEKHGADYSLARATLVARTETTGMLNAGHMAGLQQLEDDLGEAVGKEWLSVRGTTTRESHGALDGKRVKTAAGLFTLGGVKIPYPGHQKLPVEERANCQCTILSGLTAKLFTSLT